MKAGMNPILLSLIGQMGAQCVRMSPITPEAVVVRDLMVEQGLDWQYPSRYVELVGHRNRDDYRGIYLL